MSDSQRPAFLLANAYGPGAELPDRERLVLWTKFMRLAATRICPDRKPCSYRPWLDAFEQLGATPADRRNFFLTYESISRADWPDLGPEWIDFALTFLECDVMLFRSGYAKRHFLRRLCQLNLDARSKARCESILKRAVLEGTGLEEYRECCRLAAQLDPPGLLEWLVVFALGAILTLADDRNLLKVPGLSDAQRYRLQAFKTGEWSYREGMSWHPPFDLVPISAAERAKPEARQARNAWRMMRAIVRQRTRVGKPLPGYLESLTKYLTV